MTIHINWQSFVKSVGWILWHINLLRVFNETSCLYICIYGEMVDFAKSDKMIKISSKVNKSSTYNGFIHFSTNFYHHLRFNKIYHFSKPSEGTLFRCSEQTRAHLLLRRTNRKPLLCAHFFYYFGSMITRLWLFYTKRYCNRVICMVISTFLCSYFRGFFFSLFFFFLANGCVTKSTSIKHRKSAYKTSRSNCTVTYHPSK